MDPRRFQNSTAGRVIRVGEGEAAYWAFIPHPLPPKLPLDWPLMNALSEADRALGQLAGLGRTVPNPHLLIGPFVRREAVLSSRIEGTRADIADLYAYEARQEYYDLLLGVSERGAWRDWILFFLRGVAEQAQDAIARARHLQDLREEWRRRLSQARTSALTLRLVDLLFTNPVLTVPQVQKWLGMTYPGAKQIVERLIQAGILEPVGDTSYRKEYQAAEILNTLAEEWTPV